MKKSRRIPALDFTKGALVLVMVLYHWMNYFVSADGSVYRYLRFLTPSFIFITGFLISSAYLRKYKTSDARVPGRLLVRGIKLLLIVLCLNVGQGMAHMKGLNNRGGEGTLRDTVVASHTGKVPVAFSVLVPIAYLLILSSGLLAVSRWYKGIFHVSCGLLVAGAFYSDLIGDQNTYLQLVSIGMIGISVGYVSIDRINRLVKHAFPICLMYLAYVAAITRWNVIYPLQIVGVCLSLAAIYRIGLSYSETGRLGNMTVLLGQYSLFAYIAQIVILQGLHRSWLAQGAGMVGPGLAFVLAAACTVLSVLVLDRARVRIEGVNRIYAAVFS